MKKIFKNIKFLVKNDLRKSFEKNRYQMLIDMDDYYDYEIDDGKRNKINILNAEDTINLLLQNNKSFCRFGDGEYLLMNGVSIGFQDYDEELSSMLYKILETYNKDIYIGLNYCYFHKTRFFLNEENRRFYLLNRKKYRDFYLKYLIENNTYIDAGFNQMYMITENYNYDVWYSKIKKCFYQKI